MMSDTKIGIPSVVKSNSEEETIRFGAKFAASLQRGDVVALFGDLGSGKTRIVQGICSGLHVDEPVVSPTFTIVNQYSGLNGDQNKLTVHHIDCYRLRSVDDLIDIGVDEILSSDDISLIEWPQLALPLVRGTYWRIEIESAESETRRRININRMRTDTDDGTRD